MVALENEYGGAGYDKEYLCFLAATLRELASMSLSIRRMALYPPC
jgi:hypothetical protein